jgi:hypothetical protein
LSNILERKLCIFLFLPVECDSCDSSHICQKDGNMYRYPQGIGHLLENHLHNSISPRAFTDFSHEQHSCDEVSLRRCLDGRFLGP